MGGLGKLWGSVSSFVGEDVGLGVLPGLTSFLLWVSCVVGTAGHTRKFGGFELGRPGMASERQHFSLVKKEFYICI